MRHTTNKVGLVLAALLCTVTAARADGENPEKGESEASGATRVILAHSPVHNAPVGESLRVVALIDNDWLGKNFELRYRVAAQNASYVVAPFERSSSGGYYAEIPGEQMQQPGVEYYIASTDLEGAEQLHFASEAQPHKVNVEVDSNVRWAQAQRRRLRYVDEIRADLHAQDFGNRYGKQDTMLRSEIKWDHKLLHGSRFRLYSIHLGYGFIEGRTPDGILETATSRRTAARYGFGGVRLQVTPSVSGRAEAILGMDREGLIGGFRSSLTFGKLWQSNLTMGVEALEEMGASGWMRLQWDTVPPLLMGVSIYKTDLPAATLSGGTYAAYDLEYPFSDRFKLRGSLSFGSRDGPGSVGAGLGASAFF